MAAMAGSVILLKVGLVLSLELRRLGGRLSHSIRFMRMVVPEPMASSMLTFF